GTAQGRRRDPIFEFGQHKMLVIGDRLFRNGQPPCHVLVRPAPDEEQFDALEPLEFSALQPLADQRLEALAQDLFFGVPALAAAGQAGSHPISGGGLVTATRYVSWQQRQRRAAAIAPQNVGELVGGDRKQKRLGGRRVVVVGKPDEETEKRLL